MKSCVFYTSFALLLILLLFSFRWGFQGHHFPVRHVKVASSFIHVDKARFTSTILPFARQGFFTVSLHQLRRTLEAMPWIAHVSIWRVWPDVIVVHAQERKAVAVWNQTALLDEQAVIFQPSSLPSITLLHLAGSDSQAKNILVQSRILQHCLDPISLHMDALTLNDQGDWVLELHSGLQILLPAEQALDRLSHFVTAYPQIKAKQPHIRHVDLRYPNGLAAE